MSLENGGLSLRIVNNDEVLKWIHDEEDRLLTQVWQNWPLPLEEQAVLAEEIHLLPVRLLS